MNGNLSWLRGSASRHSDSERIHRRGSGRKVSFSTSSKSSSQDQPVITPTSPTSSPRPPHSSHLDDDPPPSTKPWQIIDLKASAISQYALPSHPQSSTQQAKPTD
ncbi:MAG: hypothetical protein FRX48_01409 [Lasallia pustulata]|uniref:Uncharacterized protein n=1 Tax=Lasallia pustulata TaxID=136370 RepID=A0A5M8PY04_9LECA|nr:MAG: hypothetical protein FRX48_01409 [Lasallia pustulata]